MKKIIFAFFLSFSLAASADTVDSLTRDDHNLEAAKQLELFAAVYRNLDMVYVDSLDPKQTIEAGIKGMLRSLDPYTEYYPPADAKELKSMITGKYGGIGSVVSFNVRDNVTIISEPYAGMPAQEAGLKKGDQIIAIDGEDMKGKTTSYVSDHLRGDAGTSFMLTIQRPGEKKPRKIKITRRAIQLPAIPYYGMLTDSVGYIKLDQYTEDCSAHFRNALVMLKRSGMKNLVIDLRNNTGGSLSESVSILNMFLPKDVKLVSTKGKLERANTEYVTRQMPVDTIMPIVCLVNNGTVSAAEITSGVLQDLDRGVVIGTKTFGKGLVQVPLSLPYNANVKVTSSHYYIPSGRCIQAINYKRDGKEEVADSLKREFKTRNGRIVRDGGGITPDIVLKNDTLPNIVYYMQTPALDSTNVMTDYIAEYQRTHKQIAPAKSFRLTDEEYADYCQRAIDAKFKYDRISSSFLSELKKVAKIEGYYDRAKAEFDALEKKLEHDLAAEMNFHSKEIRMALEHDIVTCYHYQAGGIEYSLQHDNQVKEAIELLNDRKRYDSILLPQSKEE
jgi:carboxyl-terminal processing protease